MYTFRYVAHNNMIACKYMYFLMTTDGWHAPGSLSDISYFSV